MSPDGEEDAMDRADLPTPSETPYRTPRSSRSNNSQKSSPESPLSPTQYSPDSCAGEDTDRHDKSRETLHSSHGERISILDPRRFTPNLHASLVGEILSLRRDLEGKSRMIDSLEISLDAARNENATLSEQIASNSKENRSLKKQMSLLEGGTMSAIEDLAKERDKALENAGEFRKRLERLQEKLKKGEEERERTNMLYERDRDTWDTEKRNLERKQHVVEGRLKMVLEEVAAAQAAQAEQLQQDASESDPEDQRDDKPFGNGEAASPPAVDFNHRRQQSTASTSTRNSGFHNYRFSTQSILNSKSIGMTLADELAFDEDEENADYYDESPAEQLSIASPKQLSNVPDNSKARKVLGLEIDASTETPVVSPPASPRFVDQGTSPGAVEDRKTERADVGIQVQLYPPQPKPATKERASVAGNNVPDQTGSDVSANQGRKRTSPDSAKLLGKPLGQPVSRPSVRMVSVSCQTRDTGPVCPSYANKLIGDAVPLEMVSEAKAKMLSTSTQTLNAEEVLPLQKQASTPPPIPVIAIHPPQTNPRSSWNGVVLPPQTKNASCQVFSQELIRVRSVSMQTEEIRVDERPVKLQKSSSPVPVDVGTVALLETTTWKSSAKPQIPAKSAARMTLKIQPTPNDDSEDAYPGNNDNGPLADDSQTAIRRPFRSSSLFAGFDVDNDNAELNEEDLFNRPLKSYTLKRGKLVSRQTTVQHPIHEDGIVSDYDDDLGLESEIAERDGGDVFPPDDDFLCDDEHSPMFKSRIPPKLGKPVNFRSMKDQLDPRRPAMISPGVAAHSLKSSKFKAGSSSSTASSRPPIPIPDRHSSKKYPQTRSEGGQSPISPTSNYGSYKRKQPAQTHVKRPSLRKVQSAAAISRVARLERQNTRSPPPLTASTLSENSQIPPLPIDDITSPYDFSGNRLFGHGPAPSTATSYTGNESSAGSVQQTSVVDAIAQTMVGEWMWKYVRRRKSFGVTDSQPIIWDGGKGSEEISASITSTGSRHKRWVWVAPYERAVMWSSRQPTSGSALLGKSGKKLAIQSVLDVKDDTPLPKSHTLTGFNRSILILTPQRALKFTAPNSERHYMWLTALSFLSHSRLGIEEAAFIPTVPPPVEPPSKPMGAKLRRHPINDSIRVAKRKASHSHEQTSKGNKQQAAQEIEYNYDDDIDDAAEPPTVPRFSAHARKRSDTIPRPPAFRNFSSHSAFTSPTSLDFGSETSPQAPYPPSIRGGYARSGRSSFSQRASEASAPSTSVPSPLHFDSTSGTPTGTGTMRMEAFVNKNSHSEMGARQHESSRTRSGKRKDLEYWGIGSEPSGRRSEESSVRMDPDMFHGF